MYPSLSQIITSLDRLSGVHPFFGYAFLGFKKAHIPIGETTEFKYSLIKEEILQKYFSFDQVSGYFNPFKSTKNWVSDRYDSTSLQRIIADTFGNAFVREKEHHGWGWATEYVSELDSLRIALKSEKIPLLDLAVWFYRKTSIKSINEVDAANSLILRIITEFDLNSEEITRLFDGVNSYRSIDLSAEPADDRDILNIVGYPADYSSAYATMLSNISIRNVGPFGLINYTPSHRLNVIAGDNSLGKTFLLEIIWWTLTGVWTTYPADPLKSHDRAEIGIDFVMSRSNKQNVIAPYSRIENAWQRPSFEFRAPVIYFAFDGGVFISGPSVLSDQAKSPRLIRLNREQLWNGYSQTDFAGRTRVVSNGLLHDLTQWQLLSERYPGRLAVFEKALRALSPPEGRPLRLGPPARLDGDLREIPTIKMPYGNVPFPYLSAGIQKAVSIAYVFVWAHFEFFRVEDRQADDSIERIVILLDEVEAHLHPKWQRRIVPALLAALEEIAPSSLFQMHVATHSPLVMTSLESEFDSENDRIHVMNFSGADISMTSQPFIKHGTVNSWLESDVFGLGTARSKPAEEAISVARILLARSVVDPADLEKASRALSATLPEDDPFWVRWNRFCDYNNRRPTDATN